MKRKMPPLDKRIVAMLLTLKNGAPPWAPPKEDTHIDGVVHYWERKEWFMCSGHIYRDEEISAMLTARWINIADKLDDCGRFQLAPGPALDEALKAAPHFDWYAERMAQNEMTADEIAEMLEAVNDEDADDEITDDDF
jgi:hypothetical protein